MANFGLFSKTPIFRVFRDFPNPGTNAPFDRKNRNPDQIRKSRNPGIPDPKTPESGPKIRTENQGFTQVFGGFFGWSFIYVPDSRPKSGKSENHIKERGNPKNPKMAKKTRKIGIKVYIYAFLMVFRGFPVEKALFRFLFLARGFRLRSVLGQELKRFWDEVIETL